METVFGVRLGAYRAWRDRGKERKLYGHLELSFYEGRQLQSAAATCRQRKEMNGQIN